MPEGRFRSLDTQNGTEAKAAAALVSEARVGELLQKLGGRGAAATAPIECEESTHADHREVQSQASAGATSSSHVVGR
jgi:hypothetical protein